jgi:hypothetical protein
MNAVTKFLGELRRDPRFAKRRDIVDNLAAAFKAVESEGFEVDTAATRLLAIEWIVSQDLTADQKLHHINRLLSLDKVENLNLREFIRLQ